MIPAIVSHTGMTKNTISKHFVFNVLPRIHLEVNRMPETRLKKRYPPKSVNKHSLEPLRPGRDVLLSRIPKERLPYKRKPVKKATTVNIVNSRLCFMLWTIPYIGPANSGLQEAHCFLSIRKITLI